MATENKYDYSALYEFCTVRQLEVLQSIERVGAKKTARDFGMNARVPNRTLAAIKKKAALRGYSPAHDMKKTVPDGYTVKGVSTYYDNEGKVRGQWVKSALDADRREQLMREAFAAMADDLPRMPPLKVQNQVISSLCNLYVMTDCHVGMMAWDRETQSGDWDLKIAEETLTGCFEQMVLKSADAETCVIAQLGDWLHYDSILGAVTPTSGHLLDSDGRFSKLVQASIRILRRLVDFALSKHQKVVVLMAEGNHDMTSSVWLRAMFQALYEHESRVHVIDSELPYYTHQHGETMLAFHHGHLSKNQNLPILFAAQFPRMWGDTRFRYVHTGHRHHVEEKEHSGITVVQHPTLAARDAYASRGGWVANRQVTSTTYHSKFGQVARVTITPEMLEAA